MFFLMQIIFIVLPSNMAAVQNLYCSVHQSGRRDVTWKPRVRKRDVTNQIMGEL